MDMSKIAEILVLIADLQAKLADVDAFVAAEKQASYDKGFADGVASVVVPPPSDKLYSQEELDAKIQEAVLPLQAKIAELEVVVAGIDQLVADKMAAFKAELLVKIQELDALEDSAVAELLK
jgi:hypothetical protein